MNSRAFVETADYAFADPPCGLALYMSDGLLAATDTWRRNANSPEREAYGRSRGFTGVITRAIA